MCGWRNLVLPKNKSFERNVFRINEAASGVLAIDGQDVSSLGLGTLRSRLTIIPQVDFLFHKWFDNNLSGSCALFRHLEAQP